MEEVERFGLDGAFDLPVVKQRPATQAELLQVLNGLMSSSYGYGESHRMPKEEKRRLDRAVAFVARQSGYSRQDLLLWCNSKHGRLLVDSTYGRRNPPTRTTVRSYLSPATLELLKAS